MPNGVPAMVAGFLLLANLAHAQPAAGTSGHVLADERIILLDPAPAPTRVWVQSDYVLWWIKTAPLSVPLVTTGDPADPFVGSLGQPSTRILVGNSNVDSRAFSGLRILLGAWLDAENSWGIEAGAFLLERRTQRVSLASDDAGNPGLYLPLQDITVGEDSFTVAFPGGVAGQVAVVSATRLWGAEANLIRGGIEVNRARIQLLTGFRHLNLEERLEISRTALDFAGLLADPANPGNPQPAGTILATTDRFRTGNQFYGGQIGVRTNLQTEAGFTLGLGAKIAFGATRQTVTVNGTTIQQLPGGALTEFPVGILAGTSNSGSVSRDTFTVVPELECKLGVALTPSLHLFTSYQFLIWSKVIRPGDQISRAVDERTIPTAVAFTPGFQGPSPTTPAFNQSSFWAQGITFGLEFRY